MKSAFVFSFLIALPITLAAQYGREPYTPQSYTQNVMDDVDSVDEPLDTAELQPDEMTEVTTRLSEEPMMPATVSDSMYIARLARLHSVMDLPFNSVVRSFIKMYTEQKRDKAAEILAASEFYFPLIEPILDQYGLPLEMRYLAVIESALNPRAVSRAGATGMWQFMYSTGKMYGLRINSTIDDRRDPVAATHAAARHLRDLYNTYNSWALAMAAYNCGAGNVNKAIRRSGKSDFWGIYNFLPRETRGYVPAFIGAAYMMSYCKEHGLSAPKYDYSQLNDYDTVSVSQWMHFDQISAVVGISVATLRDLNPQYRRDIVPGNEQPCSLKLPTFFTNAYIDKAASIALYRAEEYNPKSMVAPAEFTAYVPSGRTKMAYRVRQGDTLSSIARSYRVSVQELKQWNALRSNRINAGQRLNIYVKARKV
ncbi:MAG: transglycosylase SLT domain-containing protein [Prevotellaceae bacterium]|nr:transglycosylase SLT domain-containing protein [Prevotellaceae bacterium]